MTLPSSGPISIDMVAAELGIGVAGLSLNDSRVRNLAGRPSGTISFSDLLGKSSYTPMTLYAPNVASETDSRFGAGTAAVEVSVTILGGEGPYNIQWTMTSRSASTVTLRFSTETTCLISNPYSSNSNGSAWALLSCLVIDGAGQQASVSNVRADLFWAGDV